MHIETVLGRISPNELGLTDSHEHLFIRGGMPVLKFPDFLLTQYSSIAYDARLFRDAGGSAIVEMSPIDWGRDVKSMVRLARDLGLHIIAATGFHKVSYYSDIHWIYSYDEEQIVELVCAELTVGMDLHNYNGPLVVRSGARAGLIKVGTQREALGDIERKLLRVAAAAHMRTGAPIITHTDEGELALEQIEFLTREGVRADRIAVCHLDRRADIGYHKEVASTGAYLEYDAFTRVKQNLDAATRTIVLGMAAAGYLPRILLGGDMSRQGYWRGYGGEPGLAFVVGDFRSSLRQAGLSEADLETIYVQNPRSLLTWSASDPGAGGLRSL